MNLKPVIEYVSLGTLIVIHTLIFMVMNTLKNNYHMYISISNSLALSLPLALSLTQSYNFHFRPPVGVNYDMSIFGNFTPCRHQRPPVNLQGYRG